MAQQGTFIWKDTEVKLTHSIDTQKRRVRFENFDKAGYNLLKQLKGGAELRLRESNGNVLNLSVQTLADVGGQIIGEAAID
jgi:hypothetical protein